MLGAFQVSENGDLANWSTGERGAIPAVGGAMDLAIGAKSVYVMTDLLVSHDAEHLAHAEFAQCVHDDAGDGTGHVVPPGQTDRQVRR